ncbi:TcpQ domain-containing protein [Achromobacter sp. ACM04]|uniref:Pertussis toxin liberation protein F n=1 Tax=Achromobacter aegrifaciens TaxID=1287736 RepID=A0AAD2J5P7_ACHAE|nr:MULTISPECIES: TcpQ domain-containing protein [Achromobacter]MBD9423606.1 TcpQ domain-containing protein [Achromobacter sp. ACM04]CUJ76696.1 Pertussis toxin liberation protein F [Achromobacter aegrifaciens]
MVRFFFLAAGLSCLGACTGAGKSPAATSWEASRQAAQGFRFDWQLSGDPSVAPMQVFDDGKETWLQFAPGQPLPAIFGVGSDGERALPYLRRDPYVVLAGGWSGLLFRGGRLSARAQRLQPVADARAGSRPQDEPAPLAPAVVAERIGPARPTEPALPAIGALQAAGPLAGAAPAAGVASAPVSAPQPVYRAAPPDATLRAVLARWSDLAGWTFQPQHWAVDVDIPLSATAEFSGDFKSAVRELLGATELAERPLQPCFYGNRVLRVVPLAQSCTRMAAPGGAAT